MLRSRIALVVLSLFTLAGCATTSARAERGTRAPHSNQASASRSTDSEEGQAPTAAPEVSARRKPAPSATRPPRKDPEPAPVADAPTPAAPLRSAEAEFFCRQDGALERRAPSERPAGVVAFSAEMTRPEKLSGPQPFYTKEALDQNVQGQMLARCILTRGGTVRSCRILKPLPIMDEEVLLSLCASRYSPALDAGQPVDVEYTFNIRLTPP